MSELYHYLFTKEYRVVDPSLLNINGLRCIQLSILFLETYRFFQKSIVSTQIQIN
jgi:hypothetical protein